MATILYRVPWLPSYQPLPFTPPTLTTPKVVYVDDTTPNRIITLAAGQDCLLIMPPTPVSSWLPCNHNSDSLISVKGGRHVVVIGGEIRVPTLPRARLTADVADATVLTLAVDSTAGYPDDGFLRLDGESIWYTSKDDTHFYVAQRNTGFYNVSPISSNSAHATGATCYLGDPFSSGISFQNQTGTVHVEGLLITGADGANGAAHVTDGIRVAGGQSILQVQRCRVGPVTNFDQQYQTDQHPDCFQAFDNGAAEVRIAQCTFLLGPNGNGLLNNGTVNNSVGKTAIPLIRFWDSELVDVQGTARSFLANVDYATTVWDVRNGWLRSPRLRGLQVSDQSGLVDPMFTYVTLIPGQPDITPAETVGTGYVSPGYAA